MMQLSQPKVWDNDVVIGLDLSLTASGFARFAVDAPPYATTIPSKGKTADSLLDRSVRLETIAQRILNSMPEGIPAPLVAVAIETPAHNQTSGHHHDRSGLWWLTVSALLGQGYNVYEVSTTQVKKYATGKGNASKMEVMAAAIKRYPDLDIANDNEADAVVLAAFLARALGDPIEESLPQANLSALDKFVVSR